MDELKHFMTLAKLQVPTQRNLQVKKDEEETGKEESVRELEDGSVQITEVEIKATLCGERGLARGLKNGPSSRWRRNL